jgi:hypothetical protein
MTFKSSVNIKFDLGRTEFFERYLPTPSHATVLRGLLRGFNDRGEGKSHIVIGPYGTGKSLIGTLISGIVSNNIEKQALQILKQKFDQVDDEIYNELTKIENHKKTYLPVILNGYEGPFRQAILSAIMRVLTENCINVVIPGVVSKIFSIIDGWENNYPKTYKKFLQLLKDNKKDLELWRLELLNYNESEINWFQDVYPSLTSGAEFVADYEEGFIFQIQYVLKELEKRNLGFFIVYDEFGRFLQNISVHQIHQTMQDIQNLAELADHNVDNLHILFITHKNLRHYFLRYSEEYRNEFQRIEKRYRIYHVENDQATYVRLTQSVVHELYEGKQIPDYKEKDYIRSLRKFPLFPELNQVEIEKLVIRGSYPIHPVSLALLPYLSNLFGQNERTLFTFLEGRQKGGLMEFIRKNERVYIAPNLFDYFFPNLEEVDPENKFKELLLYRKLIKKVPGLSSNVLYLDIIKFITLWNITGLQSKYPLTNELISFALDKDESQIELALKELTQLKTVRFNSILGYWELFEGSAINIEEMINKKLKEFHVSREKRLKILEEHLSKRFYLANVYNDVKSMTRFASTHLIFSSDILNENSYGIHDQKNADAFVYFVLLESISDREKVISKLIEQKDLYNFYCVPTFEYHLVDSFIRIYELVNIFLKDEELIKQDVELKNELLLKKEETSYYIQQFLNRYINFREELTWIANGKFYSIRNEFFLEKLLSDLMFKLFPNTPEVRNDSYNRRVVNRVQLKAGYSVIDHIIYHYDEPDFNITGNGPDYLIYATIFKNNRLDIRDLDNISSKDFRLMREKLLNVLINHPYGTLSNFVDILRNSPFGVREPLIPIYLVSLLRDKWDYLSFYRNDMYIAEVNGEKLFKMIEEADQYSYVYYEFGKEYEILFAELEKLFEEYISEDILQMPKHLKLVSALLKWLRSLPRFTQISTQMAEELILLKEKIRLVEVNPNQSLESLIEIYKDDFNMLNKHVTEIESFVVNQREYYKNKVFKILNVSSYKELKQWADNQEVIVKKQNRLVKSILKSNQENWFDLLANELVGVSLEDWSDTTAEMFFVQIKHEFQQLRIKDASEHIQLSINGNVKIIPKVNLSSKSKTLYQNVQRIIKNGGRTVPKEEIEYLIYELVKEFVK